MKNRLLLLSAIFVFASIPACKEGDGSLPAQSSAQTDKAQTLDEKILGKWVLAGEGVYEFFKDGSAVFTSTKNETISGRWVSSGSDRIKVDFTGILSVSVTYIFSNIRFSDESMNAYEETNKAQVSFTKG